MNCRYLKLRNISKLNKKAHGTFETYQSIRYEGMIEGVMYKIDWLPEVKLPARVEKSDSKRLIVTQLTAIYPLNKTPHSPISTEHYEAMDFADIGDNESHPIVAQLQKNSGISYFHQH